MVAKSYFSNLNSYSKSRIPKNHQHREHPHGFNIGGWAGGGGGGGGGLRLRNSSLHLFVIFVAGNLRNGILRDGNFGAPGNFYAMAFYGAHNVEPP